MASHSQVRGTSEKIDDENGKIVRELLDDLVRQAEQKCRIDDEPSKLVETTSNYKSSLVPGDLSGKGTPSPISVAPTTKAAEPELTSAEIAAAIRPEKRTLPSSASCRGRAIDDDSASFYSVKWIEFHGIKTPILLQNLNGPCPLISICNCLLLRGHLKLEPPGVELIENDRLMHMLADLLLNEFVPRFMARESLEPNSPAAVNLEQNISDALFIFETLQYGLNVNVRFSSCTSFEYTREMDIFDLFSIALYHGWIIDPEQTEFHRYLVDKSYNQLVELTLDNLPSDNEERNYTRLLAESFLQSTAGQLTYFGLEVLQSTMRPDELAILFRNNHFSTVYKCPHNNKLYTLVTDNGYLNHKNIVWETFESIDGDGRFCNSEFKDITSAEASECGAAGDGSDKSAQYQNDYLLALSLQQDLDLEDNNANQGQSQQQQQQQQQQQRPSSSQPNHLNPSRTSDSINQASGSSAAASGGSRKDKKNKPKDKDDKCQIM